MCYEDLTQLVYGVGLVSILNAYFESAKFCFEL